MALALPQQLVHLCMQVATRKPHFLHCAFVALALFLATLSHNTDHEIIDSPTHGLYKKWVLSDFHTQLEGASLLCLLQMSQTQTSPTRGVAILRRLPPPSSAAGAWRDDEALTRCRRPVDSAPLSTTCRVAFLAADAFGAGRFGGGAAWDFLPGDGMEKETDAIQVFLAGH